MISITFDIYGAKLSTHFVLFLNVALNKTAIKNSRFNISGARSMSYLKSRLRCVFVTLRPSQIAGAFKSNIDWNWFGYCYNYFYLIMTLKGLKWIEFFWQCMFQINLSCFQNLSNCSVNSWSWRSSDAGSAQIQFLSDSPNFISPTCHTVSPGCIGGESTSFTCTNFSFLLEIPFLSEFYNGT